MSKMINLFKNNSAKARYEANYISWMFWVFARMLHAWIPDIEVFTYFIPDIEVFTYFIPYILLLIVFTVFFPISVPIIALINMKNERKNYKFDKHKEDVGGY